VGSVPPTGSLPYPLYMRLESDSSSQLAMRYLLDLALRGGGYEYRGVRGWAHSDDVKWDTRDRFSDHLARLASAGFLTRADVRTRGRRIPNWIYRIAEKGATGVRGCDGGALPRLEWPQSAPSGGDPRIAYVPAGALVALRALRIVAADPTPSPLLPGEPGWRTREELDDLVCPATASPGWITDALLSALDDLEDPQPWRGEREEWWRGELEDWLRQRPWFFDERDLNWLIRAGVAQRYGVVPAPGRRHVVVYRLTPLGAAIVPLEWHDPAPASDGEGT